MDFGYLAFPKEEKRVHNLWKKGQNTQKDYKDVTQAENQKCQNLTRT